MADGHPQQNQPANASFAPASAGGTTPPASASAPLSLPLVVDASAMAVEPPSPVVDVVLEHAPCAIDIPKMTTVWKSFVPLFCEIMRTE
jgi:hypothetical protein